MRWAKFAYRGHGSKALKARENRHADLRSADLFDAAYPHELAPGAPAAACRKCSQCGDTGVPAARPRATRLWAAGPAGERSASAGFDLALTSRWKRRVGEQLRG